MGGIVNYAEFVKKMRDMSGLLPKYIIELAIERVLGEVGKAYDMDSDEAAEFREVYDELRKRPRGLDASAIAWSKSSMPLHFVARAGIDACVSESRELSRKRSAGDDVSENAKLLVRMAWFVQMCSLTAIGLACDLPENKARSERQRFLDLFGEAKSLGLIGSSNISA